MIRDRTNTHREHRSLNLKAYRLKVTLASAPAKFRDAIELCVVNIYPPEMEFPHPIVTQFFATLPW